MGEMYIQGMRLTNRGQIDISSTGYDYVMKTVSHLHERIIEQTFYTIDIPSYVDVDVGRAAWKNEIIQNIVYDQGGDFYQGDMETGFGKGRIPEVEVTIAPKRMPTRMWGKGISWSIADVQQSAANNNWDTIASLIASLKREWSLGIQEQFAFGHPINTLITGLLNNPEVSVDTTTIPLPINEMTPAQMMDFIGGSLVAFRRNTEHTVFPDRFLMPMYDMIRLGTVISPLFPVGVSRLEYMSNAFKAVTGNVNFKIVGCHYNDAEINAQRGINRNRYVMYRKHYDTLRFIVPVQFMLFPAHTANGICWQQAAVGQYSGVFITKLPEVLYFDATPEDSGIPSGISS